MEKKWFKGKLVLTFETLAENADEAETNMMLALDDIGALGNNNVQFDKWKDAEIDIMGEAEEEHPTVTNEYGVLVDFEEAVNLMDDDIRESLNAELAPCSSQEFFDAYCKSHENKFGEPFELAKKNPVA